MGVQGRESVICHNEDELLKAHARAVSLSKTKQAIVEEFIEGDEFMAGYTIQGWAVQSYIYRRQVLDPVAWRNHALTTANYFALQISDLYSREFND